MGTYNALGLIIQDTVEKLNPAARQELNRILQAPVSQKPSISTQKKESGDK